MRLDKYLKVSRLIKRRTVANEACDAGRVSANGRPVKASYDVKTGDVLEIQFGQKTLKVEVLVVADNVRKDDAPPCIGRSASASSASRKCKQAPRSTWNAGPCFCAAFTGIRRRCKASAGR